MLLWVLVVLAKGKSCFRHILATYYYEICSTLLDLIASRKTVGKWAGQILVNLHPRTKFFNRDTAYVLQNDIHIATLTVEETLMYACWTRMT